MKKLSTRRKRKVATVRTKRDKTRSKTLEDKLKKLEDEWVMTQKDILRKPTKVQLQHLEEFKRKIKEYRKKNNIKEAYEMPLLEFGKNDADKLRKRICDEFYEHTKPKGKLSYLQEKFTSDYEKWKRTVNPREAVVTISSEKRRQMGGTK
uniref:Troponin I n=1 Tax=Strongyloides venezuelensis TaxID=75913 RepID=A0A0K0EYQ6_STRVS